MRQGGGKVIGKEPVAGNGQVRVLFRLPNIAFAERISVVGEFNDWNPAATPMTRLKNGTYKATVDLEPGRELRPVFAGEEKTLDRLDDEGHPLPVKRLLTPKLMAAAVVLLLALVGGTWWLASLREPAGEREPISVLVADFVNETGDAAFDGALEQTLAISMEGASFISAFPPATAHKLAEQIQAGSALDEEMARLISRREGVSVILLGSLEGDEDGYTVSVKALDPGIEEGEGRPLASATSGSVMNRPSRGR